MSNQNNLQMGQWNLICSSCYEEKSVDKFYLHSNGKPRKQCKDCRNKKNKEWHDKHPEIKYPVNTEKALEATRKWRRNNLAYDAQRQRERTARKLRACPSWADKDKIREIYKNCPIGFHVDHIVPLKGTNVTGLHVEHNLQYLPAKENFKKGNRHYG